MIYGVKRSQFHTFPDYKNLNLQMHICKMEVGVRFWDEEKKNEWDKVFGHQKIIFW